MTTFLSNFTYNLKTLAKLLGLSLVSSKFYSNIFKDFKGLGLKYLFTLTFIGSLLTFCLLLTSLQGFRDYLNNPNINNTLSKSLNYIFDQWPGIKYDGKAIFLENNDKLEITNIAEEKVILIDPQNKILPRDKENFLIILEPENLVFNLNKIGFKSSQKLMFSYTQLFGSTPKLINATEIYNLLKPYFDAFYGTAIYLIFPLFTLLNFIGLLLEKSFMVIFLFLLLRFFFSRNIPISSSIRLLAFASGSVALIKPLMLLSPGIISSAVNILTIWTNFLLIVGIIRVHRNYKLVV